jgi:predicted Abi (CAAX) family protease
MDMDDILRFLSLINYALGIAIGGVALYEYKSHHNITPMLIILAVVIAGPLEDFLVRMVEEKPLSPGEKERRIRLVDQLTSLGFMLFLLLAALNSK